MDAWQVRDSVSPFTSQNFESRILDVLRSLTKPSMFFIPEKVFSTRQPRTLIRSSLTRFMIAMNKMNCNKEFRAGYSNTKKIDGSLPPSHVTYNMIQHPIARYKIVVQTVQIKNRYDHTIVKLKHLNKLLEKFGTFDVPRLIGEVNKNVQIKKTRFYNGMVEASKIPKSFLNKLCAKCSDDILINIISFLLYDPKKRQKYLKDHPRKKDPFKRRKQ